ncbi:MAG: cation:proton antiporter, partial [Candidatus Micrarchaeota archaeon]|nr:cation:proton antiporter [Candidatus Micrarchaeota archaeon]
MVSDPYVERILGGGLLILSGLAARSLQKATKVPDVFYLMLGGVLAGPVLHLANPDNYQPLILLFTSLALAFLMFWIGSRLRIRTLLKGFSTNVLFALCAYTLTLALTFGLGTLSGLPFWSALLIAILMSDTGPTIVNSIIQTVRLTKAGQVGMVIESSVSNAFGLALFLGAYKFAEQGAFQPTAIASSILGTFAIALFLGALFGLAW